jgi:hypothetical protein
MIIIAHRGNVDGANPSLENDPRYIQAALDQGFNVEIDFWAFYTNLNGWSLYLGHDEPKYCINSSSFILNNDRLYIHCKNIKALEYCYNNYWGLANWNSSYFFHNTDDATITSNSKFWTYPRATIPLTRNSIPVIYNRNDMIWNEEEIKGCYGICTDDANYYNTLFNYSKQNL